MDGLEALVEIRKLYPKLPVIMFSTHTERGAMITHALARGASDYVAKPSPSETPERSHERVRKELLRKIKSLCAERAPIAFRKAQIYGAEGKVNLPRTTVQVSRGWSIWTG